MEKDDLQLFEAGESTRWSASITSNTKKMVVPQLTDLKYKVHVGLHEEDVLLSCALILMTSCRYENFKGSALAPIQSRKKLVCESAAQRREQFVVLLSHLFPTNDSMAAFVHSVDRIGYIAIYRTSNQFSARDDRTSGDVHFSNRREDGPDRCILPQDLAARPRCDGCLSAYTSPLKKTGWVNFVWDLAGTNCQQLPRRAVPLEPGRSREREQLQGVIEKSFARPGWNAALHMIDGAREKLNRRCVRFGICQLLALQHGAPIVWWYFANE